MNTDLQGVPVNSIWRGFIASFGGFRELLEVCFVAANSRELGMLHGQFIAVLENEADRIEPLAAYLYRRDDLTPGPLKQTMLRDLAVQFSKQVDNIQQASANYIYQARKVR